MCGSHTVVFIFLYSFFYFVLAVGARLCAHYNNRRRRRRRRSTMCTPVIITYENADAAVVFNDTTDLSVHAVASHIMYNLKAFFSVTF